MNGNDVLNVHPQTAAYRAMKVCSVADNESTALSDAAQDGYEGEAQFFISVTLAPNINNRYSALTGAVRTQLANPLTFIASGAAVGFWYFFPTEKGLGPAAMSGKNPDKLYHAVKICFLPVAMRF